MVKRTRMQPRSAAVEDGTTSGEIAVTFADGDRKVTLEFTSDGMMAVMQNVLLQMMKRPDETTQKSLQVFAIKEIKARLFHGMPMLQYKFESGFGFGSGYSRAELEELRRTLDEVLSAPDLKAN